MRIAQTPDGRYIKVMSPEFQGLAGRIYHEVRERERIDKEQMEVFEEQGRKLQKIAAESETMVLRYNEITELMRALFPEDGSAAKIDRALDVAKSVRAESFIATTKDSAPFFVESNKMVENLNSHYLGGRTLEEVKQHSKDLVTETERRTDQLLKEMDSENGEKFAPASHIGSGGIGVHAIATSREAGFISAPDKLKLDKILISDEEPLEPNVGQVWMDIS